MQLRVSGANLAGHAAHNLVFMLYQPEHVGKATFLGPHITPDVPLLKSMY
jgi:hypothetical protein